MPQAGRADETTIRNAGERMTSTAPAQRGGYFCGDVATEYLRRRRGTATIGERTKRKRAPMRPPVARFCFLVSGLEAGN
ncbi:MAG: hypothetical protein K9L70_07120 [Thiohalocapsa sp.]|nr:hypothetical protein [Thiohalocapsa sp.]MCF7992417.1 hypothetical protein [Thiohalocapsa sp.]